MTDKPNFILVPDDPAPPHPATPPPASRRRASQAPTPSSQAPASQVPASQAQSGGLLARFMAKVSTAVASAAAALPGRVRQRGAAGRNRHALPSPPHLRRRRHRVP